MKGCLSAVALSLVLADAAWGLDAESQRLADRYLKILGGNPLQQIAFERLWNIHADAGETETLVAECRKRAVENPVLFARVLQRAGRIREAKSVLAEAAGSGNAGAAEMLAGMLEEDGEIKAAAEIMEKLAAKHETQGILVRLGELLQKAGEAEKSRLALERAASLAPDDLVLRRRLAAAGVEAGDWERAVGHLRVIADHGSAAERFAAWGEISLHMEQAGRLLDAIAAQEALLGLMGPDHWQLDSARRRLLNLYQENRSLQVLEDKWRKQAEARPQDPHLALQMAELYEFNGDDRRRRDWLIKATTLLPKDTRLACEVASLDLSLGNPEAAAERYDKVLMVRPNDADILFLRAEVSALLGREAEAEKHVEDYLAAHKNDEAAAARALDFYRRMRLFVPLERKLSAAFRASPGDERAASDLARFYLEQGRDHDAVECLSRFDDSALAPQDAAAAAFRFAELLKGSANPAEEQRWTRAAFEKDHSRPEYALHLADLLQAAGQTDALVEILRQACEHFEGAAPREELDRRLFLVLQAKERGAASEKSKSLAPAVKEMIASIEEQAQSTRSEAAWIRLARWLLWAEEGTDAIGALRRGLQAHPDSQTLQDALAIQLAESGDTPAAIEALERLAQWAPERSPEIRRRIGHLELDRANSEEARRIFQSLAKDSKDWQAVADLALAQQMAGNWFEAFETWQRAYGLASSSARRTLRASILNAATRLQLHKRGLDFFERACVSEGDSMAREELFNEAAAYAIEHGIVDDWRSRLERRARTSTGESWREGLVSLLTAQGRVEEARRTLRASMRNSDDSSESIERLIKLAEDAGDWEEAARLARRLASLTGTQDPSPSMRYADFLERDHKRDEAEAVWLALAVRHARTPQVLTAAGDFFERAGKFGRAEDSYRAAARLRGCAPQVYLRLGRYALERADRSQALEDFETLLAQTRPEIESFRDCLPLPERVLFAPAQSARLGAPPAAQWKIASEKDNQGCRLLAIREAGQLLAYSPRRQQWCENFSAPIERLWARHYSGDKEAAFDEVERIASLEGGAAVEQAFAALALEEDEGDRLGRWASGVRNSQACWENILSAFSRMLETDWRPTHEIVIGLFSYAPALPRWRASQYLADKNFLQLASALGETVPASLPASQACSAWIELARWEVSLCEPQKALSRLDRAIDCAPSSISFDEPLFAALRARWLLTPESQRRGFEQEVSERLKASKHQKCQSAAAALIASLKGDNSLAAQRIAEVISDLGTSDGESWPEVIQQGGAQLEEWNLHRLARDLYRTELSRDSALLSIKGENFRDSTTKLLILNQLLSAERHQMPYLLNEWLARGPPERELLDAVIRLQRAGRTEAAAAVYSRLCQRNPRNEGVCSGVLNLARIRLMRQTGIAYMEKLIAEQPHGMGRALVQTAAQRLAAILDEEGEYDRSLALLDRLARTAALNKALLFQHIQALRRAGRNREALSELEANPFLAASPEFTIPLAELYAAFGRERDALALLEREARSGSVNRRSAALKLRELAIQTNEQSRVAAAEALLGSPPIHPGSQRKTFATEGDWKEALSELDNPRTPPEERFRAGRNFLVLQQDLPSNLRAEELDRLKRIAARNPQLVTEYYVLRKELSDKFGSSTDFLKELSAEWNGGRGNYHAGEIIIQILLQQKRYDELRRVLNDYLTDAHFNQNAWDQLGRRLLLVNQNELAVRAFSELRARAPGDIVRVLMLAEALSLSGRHDAADAMVSSAKGIALFDPQKQIDIAEFYLKTGRTAEAKPHLLARPVDVRSGSAWTHALERSLEKKDFAEARECIRHALDSPQAVPPRMLADYYMRSGEIYQIDPRINEFDLPRRQFRDLQIEIATRLASANDMDRAWSWIESIPSLLDDVQGRRLLQMVENADWTRAEKLWETSESSLWDARCAAAQFYLRRAQAAELPGTALKDLQRAHQLHSGSFSIAQAYATALVKQNDPAGARKVLRNLIDGYAEPWDRRSARQMLASLQASPSLPKGN
jgi:thioredoxin-like negative regulator of GroEL